MSIFRKIYQKIFNKNMKDYDIETKIFDKLKNNLADEKSTTKKVTLAIKAIENVIDSRNGWKEEKFKGLQSLYAELSKTKTLYEQVKILAEGSGTGWATAWNSDLRFIFKNELNSMKDDKAKPDAVFNRQMIGKNNTIKSIKELMKNNLPALKMDNSYSEKKLEGILKYIIDLKTSTNIGDKLSEYYRTAKTIINNAVQSFKKNAVATVKSTFFEGMEVYQDILDKRDKTISSLQNTSNPVECKKQVDEFVKFIFDKKEEINKKLGTIKNSLRSQLTNITEKYSGSKTWSNKCSKYEHEINIALNEQKLSNIEKNLKEYIEQNSEKLQKEKQEYDTEQDIIKKKEQETLFQCKKQQTIVNMKILLCNNNLEDCIAVKHNLDSAINNINKINLEDKDSENKLNKVFEEFKQYILSETNGFPENKNKLIKSIKETAEDYKKKGCNTIDMIAPAFIKKCNKFVKTNSELNDIKNKWEKDLEEQNKIFKCSQKNIKIIEKNVSELETQLLINKNKLITMANIYKNQIRCRSIEEQDKKMNEWNSFIHEILKEENSEKNKNQEAYLKKQLENIKKPLKNLYEFKAHHDNFKNSVIKQLLNGLKLLLEYDKGLSSLITNHKNEELLSNKEELGKIMKSGKIKTITMNYLYFISDIMDAVDNYDSLAASNKQDDTNESSTMKTGEDKDSITEHYLEEELHCKDKFNDKVNNVQMNGNYSEIINEMKKIVNGKYIENHSELYTPLIKALRLLREEVLAVTVESKNNDDPSEKTCDMYLEKAREDFDSNLMTLIAKASTFTLNLTKNVNDCLNKSKCILKNDGYSGVWCKKSPSKTFREMILVNYIDYLLNSQKTGMPMWNIKNGNPEIKLSDIQQQIYMQPHYVGDCWLLATLKSIISSKPDLILDCFPNRKKEINEKGEIVGNNITVRFFEVQLSAHIKNQYYLRIYCRAIKPVELILNTKLSNVGNISGVAWPNFIEKAMAIYRSKHLVKIGGDGDAELNDGSHYEYGRIKMRPITYLDQIITAWENPKEGPLEFGSKIGVGRLNNFGDDGGLTYSILTGKNGGHKRADVVWSNEYQNNNDTNENKQEFKKILEILKDASKKETTTIDMLFKENTTTKYDNCLYTGTRYHAVNNITDSSGKQNILVLKAYGNNVYEVNLDVETFAKYLDHVVYYSNDNNFQQFEKQYEMLLKRREKNPNIPATISFVHYETYKNGEPNPNYNQPNGNPFQTSGNNYLFIKYAYMVKKITQDYIIVVDPRNSKEIKVLRDDVINHFQDISFGKVE